MQKGVRNLAARLSQVGMTLGRALPSPWRQKASTQVSGLNVTLPGGETGELNLSKQY